MKESVDAEAARDGGPGDDTNGGGGDDQGRRQARPARRARETAPASA